MFNSCQAYQEAEKIDNHLNTLLKKCPITKDTAFHWRTFLRVIETSIVALDSVAREEILKTLKEEK